jgi:hypothetical protein
MYSAAFRRPGRVRTACPTLLNLPSGFPCLHEVFNINQFRRDSLKIADAGMPGNGALSFRLSLRSQSGIFVAGLAVSLLSCAFLSLAGLKNALRLCGNGSGRHCLTKRELFFLNPKPCEY